MHLKCFELGLAHRGHCVLVIIGPGAARSTVLFPLAVPLRPSGYFEVRGKAGQIPGSVGVPRETEAVGDSQGGGPRPPSYLDPADDGERAALRGEPPAPGAAPPAAPRLPAAGERGAQRAGGTLNPKGRSLALDSGFRLLPVSCHLPLPFSAHFPPDAEPGVALHPYQSPRHAGAAADPAGIADSAD